MSLSSVLCYEIEPSNDSWTSEAKSALEGPIWQDIVRYVIISDIRLRTYLINCFVGSRQPWDVHVTLNLSHKATLVNSGLVRTQASYTPFKLRKTLMICQSIPMTKWGTLLLKSVAPMLTILQPMVFAPSWQLVRSRRMNEWMIIS